MKDSKIEWCDHTFNPWSGCTKVSAGCANCYAESLDHRWGHDSWGPGKPRRRTSEGYWRHPLAPIEVLADLLDLIRRTPNLGRLLDGVEHSEFPEVV